MFVVRNIKTYKKSFRFESPELSVLLVAGPAEDKDTLGSKFV